MIEMEDICNWYRVVLRRTLALSHSGYVEKKGCGFQCGLPNPLCSTYVKITNVAYDEWLHYKEGNVEEYYVVMESVYIYPDEVSVLPLECAQVGGVPADITLVQRVSENYEGLYTLDVENNEEKLIYCAKGLCHDYEKPIYKAVPYVCSRPFAIFFRGLCELGYREIDGKCYAIYLYYYTCEIAPLICSVSGSRMVSFSAREHAQFVASISTDRGFWSDEKDLCTFTYFDTSHGVTRQVYYTSDDGYHSVACWYP